MCQVQLILYFITLMFYEEYRIRNSSLYKFSSYFYYLLSVRFKFYFRHFVLIHIQTTMFP
jgi:hypothetical protein